MQATSLGKTAGTAQQSTISGGIARPRITDPVVREMFDAIAKVGVPALAGGQFRHTGKDIDRLLGSVTYGFDDTPKGAADAKAWMDAANLFIDWAGRAYPGHKLVASQKLGFDEDFGTREYRCKLKYIL